MPEPFRKRLPSEKQDKTAKVFIGVLAYTDTQGAIRPARIRWEDGQEWEVDRVLEVREAHATKAGGFGTRFLVRIGNHQRALFLQDDRRWFVEMDDSRNMGITPGGQNTIRLD